MKFRFPIVIIDEDFRSENTSGLGIRALAAAIEKEGMEVLGVTSYGDLSQFAQQQSRARRRSSCRSTTRSSRRVPSSTRRWSTCASSSRRSASRTPRSRSTCTARRARRGTSRTTSCASCTASSTCSRTRRSSSRGTSSARRSRYLDSLAPPFFRALVDYAQDGSYSWHCPGHSGGVAFLKSPVGQMFHQFFGENMLRADVCNAVDELGQLLDHSGPVARRRAQRGAHLQRRPLLLRHQRHVDVEQDGVARQRRAGRHRRRRPQLPRVDPARDHDDRRDSGVPARRRAITSASSGRFRSRSSGRRTSEEDRGQPVRARGEEQEAADPDAHAEHLRRHRLQRRDAEADAERQHRDAALRRGVAAARGVPRLLQGHARDRQGPAAQQGGAHLRDALDAQAARGHLAGVADHRAGVARRGSSTGTSSTRRT